MFKEIALSLFQHSHPFHSSPFVFQYSDSLFLDCYTYYCTLSCCSDSNLAARNLEVWYSLPLPASFYSLVIYSFVSLPIKA